MSGKDHAADAAEHSASVSMKLCPSQFPALCTANPDMHPAPCREQNRGRKQLANSTRTRGEHVDTCDGRKPSVVSGLVTEHGPGHFCHRRCLSIIRRPFKRTSSIGDHVDASLVARSIEFEPHPVTPREKSSVHSSQAVADNRNGRQHPTNVGISQQHGAQFRHLKRRGMNAAAVHAGSDEVGPAGAMVGGSVPAAATIATQLARVSAPKIQPPNAQPGMSSTLTGARQPHTVAVLGITPVAAAAMIMSPQPSGIIGIIGAKSATSHGVSACRACRIWLAFATLPAILTLELAA